MKKTLLAAGLSVGLSALSSALFAQATRDLQIEKPWARATVAGASVGAGYLIVRNNAAAPDRLVGVASPISARVEMHEMKMDKDIMRMREVKGVDVPAKGAVDFKPGGYHLMFIELKSQLKAGDKVPVTLRFEKAGEVKTDFAVEAMGAASSHGKH